MNDDGHGRPRSSRVEAMSRVRARCSPTTASACRDAPPPARGSFYPGTGSRLATWSRPTVFSPDRRMIHSPPTDPLVIGPTARPSTGEGRLARPHRPVRPQRRRSAAQCRVYLIAGTQHGGRPGSIETRALPQSRAARTAPPGLAGVFPGSKSGSPRGRTAAEPRRGRRRHRSAESVGCRRCRASPSPRSASQIIPPVWTAQSSPTRDGSLIPFARTRQEREAARDPRPSLRAPWHPRRPMS
jgi:hypothetical protein